MENKDLFARFSQSSLNQLRYNVERILLGHLQGGQGEQVAPTPPGSTCSTGCPDCSSSTGPSPHCPPPALRPLQATRGWASLSPCPGGAQSPSPEPWSFGLVSSQGPLAYHRGTPAAWRAQHLGGSLRGRGAAPRVSWGYRVARACWGVPVLACICPVTCTPLSHLCLAYPTTGPLPRSSMGPPPRACLGPQIPPGPRCLGPWSCWLGTPPSQT